VEGDRESESGTYPHQFKKVGQDEHVGVSSASPAE